MSLDVDPAPVNTYTHGNHSYFILHLEKQLRVWFFFFFKLILNCSALYTGLFSDRIFNAFVLINCYNVLIFYYVLFCKPHRTGTLVMWHGNFPSKYIHIQSCLVYYKVLLLFQKYFFIACQSQNWSIYTTCHWNLITRMPFMFCLEHRNSGQWNSFLLKTSTGVGFFYFRVP